MFWKLGYRFPAEAGKFARDMRERERFHRAGANER
jgi:hypothetical protein